MMEEFITYLIKVNIAITVFYLIYRLIFDRDTFFYLRRGYLMGSVLFSLLFPFMQSDRLGSLFSLNSSSSEVYGTVQIGDLSATALLDDDLGASFMIDWMLVIKVALLLVGSFLAIKILWQLWQIIKIKIDSEQRIRYNITFQHLKVQSTPFSFFKWIFIYPEAHTDEKLKQILTHENVHVKQWHSVDVMLMELLMPLIWYNPFFWLLRKEIAINIEFIADQCVLGEGVNRREYQYHILHLTYPRKNIQLVNNFNVSQLKQRIMMMNKEKTPMKKLLKYTLVLPVVLLLITANSVYAQKTNTEKSITEPKIVLRNANDTIVKPLIIIDGKVMGKEYDLTNISPDVIESISVLKDKSGTSLYGEDGKDGVIIITTKKKSKSNLTDTDDVFMVVEEQPEFPGGSTAMMQFLSENVKYPKIAHENGIQGRVILSFIVEKDGSISEINVVRGVDPSLDLEAKRVIESMPNWKPGKQSGKEVRVKFTLPVVFRLQGGESNKSSIKEDKQIDAKAENVMDEIVVVGYAQSKSKASNDELFVVVEEQPEYPGGNEAMMKFLSESIKYPQIAKENGIQGRVIVNFVVEKDGAISDIQVVRGVDPALDAEAMRVIGTMPKWKPGKQRGQEVRVRFTLPLEFRLPPKEEVK